MIKEEEATLHILTTRGRRVYHLQFCSEAEKFKRANGGGTQTLQIKNGGQSSDMAVLFVKNFYVFNNYI